MNRREVPMTDAPPFEGSHDPRRDRERLLAEYLRLFRHAEDGLIELAEAIAAARIQCNRMQQGRLPTDLHPESLASLLLSLVSDLSELHSATDGLITHLDSLAVGAEPR
jgi:hypothetical protein